MKLRIGSVAVAVVLLAVSVGSQTPQVADVSRHIKRDDLVDLARQLVRIRSDYDEGVLANHKEMAAFLAGQLKGLGFEAHIAAPEPDYPTVIGRLRGTGAGPTFGILAHYNTVAIGDPSKWTVDPFGGEVRDGRVYGRGAADQKMSMAASLVAARAVRDAGVALRGTLVLLFIPGEGAQTHSLPHIVKDSPELLKADWYLDSEGGANILKYAGGWVWATITVDGSTGHTGGDAVGHEGRPINAIYRLARVLAAMEDVDTWLTYKKHPLFPLPEYDGKPVVEVGKIEGGYKVNQVPDRAEAQVDIRLLPGMSPDGALADLRTLFSRLKEKDPALNVRVEPMTTQWVPLKHWESLTDEDPLVKAIREVAPPLMNGKVPGWSGGIGGGRPDLWATGAKYVSFGGPGGGGNAHGPDEWASIDGGLRRAEMFARLIVRMLGPGSGAASVR